MKKMERLCKELQSRVMSAEAAAELILPGMTLGMSGFGVVGYPKLVPEAIARLGKADGLRVFTGATVGTSIDDVLINSGLVDYRGPYQGIKGSRTAVNEGRVGYLDMHLSHMPTLANRWPGAVDVAVIECAMVTEDGLVPTTSVGSSTVYVKNAKQVIVELNTGVPENIYGFHDNYVAALPEQPAPIPVCHPMDRAGEPFIACPMDKIAAVVYSDRPDECAPLKPTDDTSRAIAGHIVRFLRDEIRAGRQPASLYPIQSGVGSVANAVLDGLRDAGFSNLYMYTEVFQDAALEMMKDGILAGASATAWALSREGLDELLGDLDPYRSKLVLRSQEISNHPEVVRRMGLIAMNTPIEFDIFGNVNSTHIMGRNVMNGIGGSGDFARNAGLSVFASSSVAKGGNISCIVPMVSHTDHTEHDTQVFVTEQGLADLRWKSPVERAELIIEQCAHPDYRPMLRDYLARAKRGGGNTPILLDEALSWHERYERTGSMKGER